MFDFACLAFCIGDGIMDETISTVTKLNVSAFAQNHDSVINLNRYLNMCIEAFANTKKIAVIPSTVIDGEYDVGSELHEFATIKDFYNLFNQMIDTYNCFLLSGESGIGKSMLIRKIVTEFSQLYLDNLCNYVPLYLDCKDFSDENDTLMSWIESTLRDKYSNFDYFKSGRENDYYIIFIDSINKLKSSSYEDFMEQIDCWNSWMLEMVEKDDRVKFVIASEKIPFVVGIDSYFKHSFDVVQFYLQPLTNKQIEYLIDNSRLQDAEKNKLKKDVFNKYSSLSFIRLPFYADKLIKASKIVTNLKNKTMFIEYLLKLTIDGTKFKRSDIDALLQKAAYKSVNSNRFYISDFDEYTEQQTQELLQFCVNSSIIIRDDNDEAYSFSHQIFLNYYLGVYLLKSSAWNGNNLERIMLCNSRLDNIEPLKHLFNLLGANDKKVFFEFLSDNDLLIAANCIVESTDFIELKERTVSKIISLITNPDYKSLSFDDRKAFGLLLGLLGDSRFSHSLSFIEPQVVKCGEIFVGKYPVTNLEYSRFLDDQDYLNDRFWSMAKNDLWFEPNAIVNSVYAHWKKVQGYLRSSMDLVKTICGKKRYNKNQCACLFYFLKMDDDELKSVINDLYGNNTPVPIMWKNPEYNNPSMPVIGVSIYEAMAYCEWLSYKTSKKYRLLTSDEWFYVSGGERRNYPYGNRFEQSYINTIESEWDSILAVGIIPQNCTSTGVYDMSGNIFEWTSSIWTGNSLTNSNRLDIQYICRGGSWIQGQDRAALSYIGRGKGWVKNIDLGFRICYEN